MKYKNYRARVEYSEDDEVFYGRVLGVRDSLLFDGKSVAELKREFKATIDGYLEACRKEGKATALMFAAELSGKSINEEVVEAIDERLRRKA